MIGGKQQRWYAADGSDVVKRLYQCIPASAVAAGSREQGAGSMAAAGIWFGSVSLDIAGSGFARGDVPVSPGCHDCFERSLPGSACP